MADGTPDKPDGQIGDKQNAAIACIDDFITRTADGERLPAHILDGYSKGFTLGWCVRVNFSDGNRRKLYVLVNGDFPYTAPRVALAGGADILAWPHFELDGLLCILPTDAAVSGESPVGVVEYVLGEACRLIEECIKGDNADAFRREFLSYWLMAADRDDTRFISLVEPQGPGRRILVWHGKGTRVVADDRETLKRWLQRCGAKKGNRQDYQIHDGVLIWLPEPLLPVEYPRAAADLRSLAQGRSPEAATVLEEVAASGANEIDVLLGAATVNGTCFAAVKVRPPVLAGGPKKKGNPLIAGFRPDHVPRTLMVDRYLSSIAKVTKATVERADHRWIHGRDQDLRQERLRTLRVAVLGCGSVGGPLAKLLAQAGVSNLLLVDCGPMDWPNVGRHELGATSVNRNKAEELAGEIEHAYPHLGNVSWRKDRVGPSVTDLIEELVSCNLIVSTMGNWAGESFLNDAHQERSNFPPILYGWVEPNAAAAHAVLLPQGSACFRCGVNDKGRPHLTVTQWEGVQGTLQEPACGALFTPYGPVELRWAHALLGEIAVDALTANRQSAIHRVWIGAGSRIRAAGGAWSEKWVSEMGDPLTGGFTVERTWPASASCPTCHGQERAA